MQNLVAIDRIVFLLHKKSTTFWDNPRISSNTHLISSSDSYKLGSHHFFREITHVPVHDLSSLFIIIL